MFTSEARSLWQARLVYVEIDTLGLLIYLPVTQAADLDTFDYKKNLKPVQIQPRVFSSHLSTAYFVGNLTTNPPLQCPSLIYTIPTFSPYRVPIYHPLI